MNDETICNPVPGAEVDGFNFFRDQNGMIVARCCWCMIGFDVTAKNVATIRPTDRCCRKSPKLLCD